MTIHWHQGHNIPGYMPDDDQPPQSLSIEQARTSLVEDIQFGADQFHELHADGEDPLAVDKLIAEGHDTIVLLLQALDSQALYNGYTVTLPRTGGTHDQGMAYWIHQCSDEACEPIEEASILSEAEGDRSEDWLPGAFDEDFGQSNNEDSYGMYESTDWKGP
jgi:hypothetical protein